jgi:hypothetical protein
MYECFKIIYRRLIRTREKYQPLIPKIEGVIPKIKYCKNQGDSNQLPI